MSIGKVGGGANLSTGGLGGGLTGAHAAGSLGKTQQANTDPKVEDPKQEQPKDLLDQSKDFAGEMKKVTGAVNSAVGKLKDRARSQATKITARAESTDTLLQDKAARLGASEKKLENTLSKVGKAHAGVVGVASAVGFADAVDTAVKTGEAKDIAAAGKAGIDMVNAGADLAGKLGSSKAAEFAKRTGVAAGAAGMVDGGVKAFQHGQKAVEAFQKGDMETAQKEGLDAAKNAAGTARGALTVANGVNGLQQAKAAKTAVREGIEAGVKTMAGGVKNISDDVVAQATKAASNAAADAAKAGKSVKDAATVAAREAMTNAGVTGNAARNAAKQMGAGAAAGKAGAEAVLDASKKATTELLEKGGIKGAKAIQKAGVNAIDDVVAAGAKLATKSVSKGAAKAAGRAAAATAAKGGAKLLAKSAGRLVPGMNIAMAAIDTAEAAKIISDPKASTTKKVAAGFTAAASAVAATNIPVVSQVAGVASIAGSLIRDWF